VYDFLWADALPVNIENTNTVAKYRGPLSRRFAYSNFSIMYLVILCILCNVYDRKDTSQLPSTSWSHVEVVHYTMLFLVSLAHSYADIVQPVLCNSHNLSHWLKRLTLESPEVCLLLTILLFVVLYSAHVVAIMNSDNITVIIVITTVIVNCSYLHFCLIFKPVISSLFYYTFLFVNIYLFLVLSN